MCLTNNNWVRLELYSFQISQILDDIFISKYE